ncbi:MAG: Lrp/AsnC ligand binding domain-containing protein [Candidatus Nitrosoabyssus spongiisocia]|nr:MAG: Lrp/AsnC ligand binding domain-containing protein [Nitrosopumilaceae archaeon AB1(1)]
MSDTHQTSALALISTTPSANTRDVAQLISNITHVTKVHEITGKFDIAIFITADNIYHINEAIDKLRKIPTVANTDTMIILSTI